MKAPQEDPNAEASPACAQCGQRLRADETEGVCSACLVMRALTPDPERGLLGNDRSRTTTWAEEFPHLEIGQCLRKDGEVDILQARDLEDGSELWLLIAAEATVQKYGGLDSWERSYRALRQLNHSHLGRVLDFGELGARFFILLQAPQGRPLETLEDSLSLIALEKLMVQVDDALASARAVGVSLGLRFADVMVSDDQEAVLIPSLKPAFVRFPSEATKASKPIGPHMVLGSYTLIDKLGEGGFAEVWLARQDEPVQRQVALKILKEGMDTQRILARFEAERQALALLDHPYITRVHDAGSTDGGRPYFIMEAVDGQPIDAYCRETKATLESRLHLVMRVCQAVQYAHHKAIIHRDLKPSNILVTADGEDSAVPKVIDFGIAKALDHHLTERTVHTREHHFLGTPDYMSPEQMAGGRNTADSRSDVYSLGIVLFELLTGSTPFDRTSSKANVPFGVRGSDSLSYEAPKPSARLDSARDAQKHTKGMPEPHLPRELDWIVLKALEYDPDRRYQSPDQLREDLRRFLEHEAVEAGPPTRRYRAGKFVRRHRVAVASGLAVMAALVIGAGLALLGLLRAETERERAVAAQAEAKQEAAISSAVNSFLQNDLLRQASPVRSGQSSELTLRAALDRAAATMDERFEAQPEVLASLHLTLSDTYRGLSLLDEAEQHARESARLREARYGWEHRDTLWAHSQLASVLSDQSKFAEALDLHERVLEGKRKVLGREHASALRTEWRIAELHGKLGDYQRAEAMLRETLARQEQVLGIDHPDTRSTKGALARWLFDQGTREKRAAAVGLAREEHQFREQTSGPDHSGTLTSLHVLATMLHQSGHAEEAEPMHRRLLERRREIFGEKHAFTLTSMNNLAHCLEALGRDAEAIEIYRELVPMQRETFGVRDWITLAILQNFGATLGRLGKHGEALVALEEVYEVGAELLGAEHPRVLTALGSIADNHAALGEIEEAIDIRRRLLKGSRKVIGTTHPQTLMVANNLALNLSEVGDIEGAKQVWQDMVAAVEKDTGPNDVRLAELLVEYGFVLYEHMKRAADAVPILKRAETIYLEALGPDDKKTKEARMNWLTSRRIAGEQMTPEEVREVFRLFEEVNGQTMGEFQREMQAKEGAEAE